MDFSSPGIHLYLNMTIWIPATMLAFINGVPKTLLKLLEVSTKGIPSVGNNFQGFQVRSSHQEKPEGERERKQARSRSG